MYVHGNYYYTPFMPAHPFCTLANTYINMCVLICAFTNYIHIHTPNFTNYLKQI